MRLVVEGNPSPPYCAFQILLRGETEEYLVYPCVQHMLELLQTRSTALTPNSEVHLVELGVVHGLYIDPGPTIIRMFDLYFICDWPNPLTLSEDGLFLPQIPNL